MSNLAEQHANFVVIVDLCKYPGYSFTVTTDSRGATYLQGKYLEADTESGRLEEQTTRRWFLNPKMTKSEIVQTVFKCLMTSMEHRAREWFHYNGKSIFGPHFDVDALWELCDKKKDTREP